MTLKRAKDLVADKEPTILMLNLRAKAHDAVVEAYRSRGHPCDRAKLEACKLTLSELHDMARRVRQGRVMPKGLRGNALAERSKPS